MFLVAVLLLAAGVAGLVARTRSVGRFGRLGWVGLAVSLVGAAVLITSSLVQTIFFGGDFPLMPLLVIPGGLALIGGLLVFGITIMRARILPLWVTGLFVAGAVAMLGFNDQNAQVLMAVPLGIAWVGVGYALWSEKDTPTQQPSNAEQSNIN